MAFNVNEFRTQMVGDGARPNLFEVGLPFPGFAAPGNAQAKTTFMARGAQIPGASIGVVPVTYFGRELKFAGNRIFADWTITVINDEDFIIRNAMERWMNGINGHTTNVGLVNPTDYQADLIVEQLDRDGTSIKRYDFRGAFPTLVGEIDLDYDVSGQIEEFAVSFAYQYWESNTTS